MGGISIHAPREGSDRLIRLNSFWSKEFQSTLPVRGATLAAQETYLKQQDFNPRSP